MLLLERSKKTRSTENRWIRDFTSCSWIPSLAAAGECEATSGHRRQVILVFLSREYKFSRCKHSLLLHIPGSRQGQTHLQVTWPQNDRAAVWPLMTATWHSDPLIVRPLICLQQLSVCRLSRGWALWKDHKGTEMPIVITWLKMHAYVTCCCPFCSLMQWDSTDLHSVCFHGHSKRFILK